MFSIKDLQSNVANISRSAWLASLGAIATVSQESKQIVEIVSQWNSKQSVVDFRNKYHQVLTNFKASVGSLINQMSMPKFATVS